MPEQVQESFSKFEKEYHTVSRAATENLGFIRQYARDADEVYQKYSTYIQTTSEVIKAISHVAEDFYDIDTPALGAVNYRSLVPDLQLDLDVPELPSMHDLTEGLDFGNATKDVKDQVSKMIKSAAEKSEGWTRHARRTIDEALDSVDVSFGDDYDPPAVQVPVDEVKTLTREFTQISKDTVGRMSANLSSKWAVNGTAAVVAKTYGHVKNTLQPSEAPFIFESPSGVWHSMFVDFAAPRRTWTGAKYTPGS